MIPTPTFWMPGTTASQTLTAKRLDQVSGWSVEQVAGTAVGLVEAPLTPFGWAARFDRVGSRACAIRGTGSMPSGLTPGGNAITYVCFFTVDAAQVTDRGCSLVYLYDADNANATAIRMGFNYKADGQTSLIFSLRSGSTTYTCNSTTPYTWQTGVLYAAVLIWDSSADSPDQRMRGYVYDADTGTAIDSKVYGSAGISLSASAATVTNGIFQIGAGGSGTANGDMFSGDFYLFAAFDSVLDAGQLGELFTQIRTVGTDLYQLTEMLPQAPVPTLGEAYLGCVKALTTEPEGIHVLENHLIEIECGEAVKRCLPGGGAAMQANTSRTAGTVTARARYVVGSLTGEWSGFSDECNVEKAALTYDHEYTRPRLSGWMGGTNAEILGAKTSYISALGEDGCFPLAMSFTSPDDQYRVAPTLEDGYQTFATAAQWGATRTKQTITEEGGATSGTYSVPQTTGLAVGHTLVEMIDESSPGEPVVIARWRDNPEDTAASGAVDLLPSVTGASGPTLTATIDRSTGDLVWSLSGAVPADHRLACTTAENGTWAIGSQERADATAETWWASARYMLALQRRPKPDRRVAAIINRAGGNLGESFRPGGNYDDNAWDFMVPWGGGLLMHKHPSNALAAGGSLTVRDRVAHFWCDQALIDAMYEYHLKVETKIKALRDADPRTDFRVPIDMEWDDETNGPIIDLFANIIDAMQADARWTTDLYDGYQTMSVWWASIPPRERYNPNYGIYAVQNRRFLHGHLLPAVKRVEARIFGESFARAFREVHGYDAFASNYSVYGSVSSNPFTPITLFDDGDGVMAFPFQEEVLLHFYGITGSSPEFYQREITTSLGASLADYAAHYGYKSTGTEAGDRKLLYIAHTAHAVRTQRAARMRTRVWVSNESYFQPDAAAVARQAAAAMQSGGEGIIQWVGTPSLMQTVSKAVSRGFPYGPKGRPRRSMASRPMQPRVLQPR